MNYSIIYPNKLYNEIAEILQDEDLKMNDLNDKSSVIFQISKYLKNCNFIKFSENIFDNSDEMFDDMCRVLKETNKDTINTTVLYSNDEYIYEMVYFEFDDKKKYDETLENQLASISNIELLPIYDKTTIIKTKIKNNIKGEIISINDLIEITLHNFYNVGMMIDSNGKSKEIEYVSEDPYCVIGNNFEKKNEKMLYNICFLLYKDKNDDKIKNEIVSKIFDEDITGRCFIVLLSPLYYRKIWNMNINMLNLIIKSIDNKNIEKEFDDNRTINPFVAIYKHIK